jgi:hypothetical protein
MSQPLLSILIPTVIGREKEFMHLKGRIESIFQNNNIKAGTVECRAMIDDKRMTIGEKREKMYKEAKGLYSWQVDDDDDISDDSIILILRAIKQKPDCITFQEKVVIDGGEYKSNHSMYYPDWAGDGNKILDDGFHFQRTPFFKSVIRTDIARKVPIPHIRFGEDHQWAQALNPLLQTEVHIEEQIYLYTHNSSDPTERYGLDKS